jgi:ATP-dependent helicase/nuclease subunit A
MSMRFVPTEEQARAISTLARQVCISAGAGSGKTRVLAERFVAAVDPSEPVRGWTPVDVTRALTVTFTDKAAGEIAERVRRVFLEHGLVAEARRVDEAWISTIHGLCTRLLRSHAIEAGLDPGFAVISAVDAGALREEVLEGLLRDELAAGRATGLVAAYGAAGVADLVESVYDRLRAMGAECDAVTLDDPECACTVLDDAIVAVAGWAARLSEHDSQGKTLQRIVTSATATGVALRALRDHGPADPTELAGETLHLLHRSKLPLSVGGAKELVLDCADERSGLIDRAVRVLTVPLSAALLELVRAFGQRYSAAKGERGALDFEDLQIRCVELLSTPDGPAARYRELFRLVMIDEFQDTNEVQAALADRLADGTLCTVGDERQSIYGFRYADVDVYRRHTERMLAEGAEPARLAANFRSHGDILAFVNEVFSHETLFGQGFLRLEHGRDETSAPPVRPEGEPRVELMLVGREGRSGVDARAVEAEAVARRLRELIDAGVPQGDIVLLMRALTHADTYAAALRRHDVDYTVVAGGSFFGRPEVEAVRALLRAASNPLDDEALARVLASGIVGLSWDSLARLRHAAGRGSLWSGAGRVVLSGADDARLRQARVAIETARADAERRPIAEIVHRACERLDYDLYLLARGADGRWAYANVLKLTRLAEEFERAGGAGVRDFLEHLALKERYRDREAPASLIDERAEAVRIMSVHGAKGLEFPVVVVPELGRDQASDTGPLVLEKCESGGRLALSLADDGSSKPEERRSCWASTARERARLRERDEEKRLFYVACTRARDVLILSGAGDLDKPAGESSLGWLRRALTLEGETAHTGSLTVGGAQVRVTRFHEAPSLAGPPVPRVRLRAPEACLETEEPHAAGETPRDRPGAPPEVSFSAMRLHDTCALRYLVQKVVRVGDARPQAPHDPLRFGDAVHAALRLVGPCGTPPTEDRFAAIARRWRLPPEEESRLRGAVSGFLRSSTGRDAYAEGMPGHEVPFAVPLDGATLVGKIDLLVRVPGGARVVDYKTGADALAEVSDDDHRAQADCYALAVLTSGASTVEVVFVGVETGDGGPPREAVFKYAAADRPRLFDGIGERARALKTGPYEPLPAYRSAACDSCPAARGICPLPVPSRPSARAR